MLVRSLEEKSVAVCQKEGDRGKFAKKNGYLAEGERFVRTPAGPARRAPERLERAAGLRSRSAPGARSARGSDAAGVHRTSRSYLASSPTAARARPIASYLLIPAL